jgi:hypothetical protein
LEDAFAVARQTQGQKQRKWGWLNKSKEKEGKVRNGGLSHGDVDTCCISMVSSIKPLDIGGIKGFFFGHIWESARSGPRVVEEWPRVCSGSGDSVLRVEEKMSNNSNYGGGQGRNWKEETTMGGALDSIISCLPTIPTGEIQTGILRMGEIRRTISRRR